MDETFRRLRYVRYADDFIISVIGSRRRAYEVMQQVRSFLKDPLCLELNLGKTKLTHARKNIAHFLGTDIRWNANITDKKVSKRKRSN